MKVSELEGLELVELNEKERQLRQELFNLRFQLATGRIENPMRIRQARRDLARIKTVQHQVRTSTARGAQSKKG